jgi:hypothetical protein
MLHHLFLKIDGRRGCDYCMGRRYDRPPILCTPHKSHIVITDRTMKEIGLTPKRLFHGSHEPIGAG